MTYPSALLVLTSPLSHLTRCVRPVLTEAIRQVDQTLYVHIAPGLPRHLENNVGQINSLHPEPVPPTRELIHFVRNLYSQAAAACRDKHVRVLLDNVNNTASPNVQRHLQHGYHLLLAEGMGQPHGHLLLDYIKHILPSRHKDNPPLHFLNDCLKASPAMGQQPGERQTTGNIEESGTDQEATTSNTLTDSGPGTDLKSCSGYEHVVLGGTFDRLHVGHQILLSEALMLATCSVTIGVTEHSMNQKKTLVELIRPTSERIGLLTEYLRDIKPNLSYQCVPITDPFGPSITDPQLQCIVVSQETLRGGQTVNTKRKERGLSQLDIHVIDLIEDEHRSQDEEEKISSSSFRRRLLGTLISKPQTTLKAPPYLIGLTGGIASSKSSICKRLAGLGAAVVDCDRLGHKAYLKDSPTFEAVVAAFGEDIVGPDGEINRRALGSKVFSDKSQLEKLNQIVWPAIAELAQKEIDQHAATGVEVVVLDAAVLLEAGWDKMVHEVWVATIPKEEAVKRIMDRNGLTREEAEKRIQSQMSIEERVSKANVPLSTLWEYDVTQKQVEKAWGLLMQRVKNFSRL